MNYLNNLKNFNIHKKYEKIIDKLPINIKDLNNIIIYGSQGIGKYSQALNIISKYSKNNLQYEKRIVLNIQNKYNITFKISDIHYEVDMSLLGCNAKLLWHELYYHILDILYTNRKEYGIILCKNFDKTNDDLLDIIYYYMNQSKKLKFILITENLSFFNDNIINFCDIFTFSRPSKNSYNKLVKINKNVNIDEITNIKNMKLNIFQLMNPNKIICDKIIEEINKKEDINFSELRVLLYDILIYQLDIGECIWYIINKLNKEEKIDSKYLIKINEKIYEFYKYYNNNYRPIFHLERLLLYLCKVINGF